MPPRTCKEVVDHASFVVDGEVNWFIRQWIRLHLAVCPPCRRYYRQFEAVNRAARELGREESPAASSELVEGVMQCIEGARSGD